MSFNPAFKTSYTCLNVTDCNDIWAIDERYVQSIIKYMIINHRGTGTLPLLAGLSQSIPCGKCPIYGSLPLYEMTSASKYSIMYTTMVHWKYCADHKQI